MYRRGMNHAMSHCAFFFPTFLYTRFSLNMRKNMLSIHQSDSNTPLETSERSNDSGSALAAGANASKGPHRAQIEFQRQRHERLQTLASSTEKIIQLMDHLQLNLAVFLSSLLWGCEELVDHDRAKWHRTCLVLSDELPSILQRLNRPPSVHDKSAARGGAREVIDKWAEEHTIKRMNEEMKLTTERYEQPKELVKFLTIKSLSKLEYPTVISDHKKRLPVTWNVLRSIAYTNKQEKRNSDESAETADIVSDGT